MKVIRRRRVWPILICASGGLLAAILVAWAFALLSAIPMYPRGTIRAFVANGRVWNVAEVERAGLVDVWWSADEERSSDLTKEAKMLLEQARERAPGRPVPRTTEEQPRWDTMRNPTPDLPDIGSDTAFGWPLPCMWYQVTGVLSQNSAGQWQIDGDRLRGGFLIKGDLSSLGRDFRAIPLRPIPLALVANTLALATPLWIFLVGVPWIRRSMRLRRGLCPACGYNRRGLAADAPCPECGAADPPRPA